MHSYSSPGEIVLKDQYDQRALFQATLFFRPEHFKTAIPVCVTTMLVMYTLNNSVSSKLPPTSYVKLIDIWLLFGLILPFYIILLLITIEHLPKPPVNIVQVSSGKSPSKTLKSSKNFFSKLARVYLPILEGLFILCYAGAAFILY